jgi:CubicO group peptidase (beta-lactamase class C family)
VAGITVADLLTMQAGLERTSGGNYGGWVSSRNWVADALSRPMVREPGEGMLYSTGSYHILGAVLAEATGRSLLEQARDGLGQPLDIDVPPWTRDPQGYYMGGNEMAMSPLAMFRFGEVYRLGGAFGGHARPVRDWVEASFEPRTRSNFSGDLYGYGWFLRDVGGHRVAYARGYGGQMIFVVPSLRLTVAITSDPNRPARSDGHVGDLQRLLAETIIPRPTPCDRRHRFALLHVTRPIPAAMARYGAIRPGRDAGTCWPLSLRDAADDGDALRAARRPHHAGRVPGRAGSTRRAWASARSRS